MATAQEVIDAMAIMDNAERIILLRHLFRNHFDMNPLTEEEMQLIDDLRDGYVKVVATNEL